MYMPVQFKEDRVPLLHETIRRIAFGTLVTHGPDGLIASHVPMLIDAESGPYGTLSGHLARPNPQGRQAVEGEALAIFLGPDAYISPSLYATKRASGKVVPTWNYAAIHAYGPLSFYTDPDRLLALVTRLTEVHEAGRAAPWAVSDAPADFVRAQLNGIVGFELPITRLEGKWKMSQNRSAEDRAGVAAGLEDREVAEIVASRSSP
ncbi:MAG TPA: FMN-binding negative transcriptional regulator [Aliidongia sp.]|nr:FMN-binding negative transcriptional regulator [Aliidongia sp.]